MTRISLVQKKETYGKQMALFNEPPTRQLAAHPVCVWHSVRAASYCQEKKNKILQPFGGFSLEKWGDRS